MLKKLLPALVVFVIFGLLPIFAVAASSHQAKFVIGKVSYEADGRINQMDAAPFIENGRTYVPIRYLALALGVAEKDIVWDAKIRTVTLKLDNVTLKLAIGNKTLYVNGQAKQMDVAPVIKSGRTYLPARWVAEAFGYEVHWDAGTKTVLVCPPGQVVKPEPQPVGYRIDWDAAKSGALQPPANAVAPPDVWGFPAKAVRMEFKVGSRYATVTRTDGSTYTLDLGTPCVVVSDKEGTDWFKSKYPNLYTNSNCVTLPGTVPYVALYVPFIPVAEAFGVPRENIVWDGEHLAVFGYYGNTENYRVLMPGTREAVCKVVGNNPEVGLGQCEFPLFVKDGVPMVGINSTSDIYGMLFMTSGGNTPNLINAMGGASWNYETGTAMAIVTNE